MPESNPKPRREKDKSDLVNDAMDHPRLRMKSYEAWDLTVEQLTDKLKEADRG